MPSHYDDIAAEDNFEMAEQWIAARNPEKAVEHLKKTIDLNPHFIFAYITLARTLSGMGRHDEAFHVMKRAEREDPEFDYLFFLAAKFAFRQGDLIAAYRHMEQAEQKSPRPHYRTALAVIERARRETRR